MTVRRLKGAAVRAPLIRLLLDREETCIDGFAGGGGASTGIEMALGRSPDLAINHDAEALAMHAVNHPETRHIRSNIRRVSFRKECKGQRVGFAWFSPDCTFHSKARGGRPFRDRDRARRVRGLAWEAVRCAVEVRPRLLFIENVEEFFDWAPLDKKGRPVRAKRGASYRRWVARLQNLGYRVEARVLRASDFGSPTSRRRLFIIARCDGLPVVWPDATHGPARATPYATMAECTDFAQPVPSIFFTPAQAKAWAKALGVPSPKRPLAAATLRRIARGVQRYVLDTAQPFIVSVRHHDDSHAYSIDEPLRTIPASDREFALVAPTLINTRNGERAGQAPRVFDITQPYPTITALGSQGALVTAFLAKHNGGHEATGQPLDRPLDTVVCRENKALVTSHLLKLRGGVDDHLNTAQDLRLPLPTLTAGGTHYAEVRAFLLKFYGTKKDGCRLDRPLDTVTTKDRFGLVTVMIGGEEYAIVDIGMRMLTPRELFRAQGFPTTYQIAQVRGEDGVLKPLTKRAQTRLCGNSVPPHVAAALVKANYTPEAAA